MIEIKARPLSLIKSQLEAQKSQNQAADSSNKKVSSLSQAQGQLDKRDPRILDAAKGFEGQFIRQMISEMRKTVPEDEVVPETMADKIFREQLDNEYADQWVGQGGVGLADLIYDQLIERFKKKSGELPKGPDGFIKFSQKQIESAKRNDMGPVLHDLFDKKFGSLFLAKKSGDGFQFRSRFPLEEKVSLRSPMSGFVLQAAAMENGQEMVVVKHDQGMVTQLVHSGHNHVKTGTQIKAGDVLADLFPSSHGDVANVFFGLRKASKLE